MKKIFILCILILIPIIIYSRTIWVERNLYSAGSNLNVGDIVKVVINDLGRLQFDIVSKNSTAGSVESTPDVNITGFLPRVSGNKSIKNNDSLNYSERRRLAFSVGAQVQNATPNGQFNIAGTRVYSFDGMINTVTVSGVVDSTKVKNGAVDATDIGNFRLVINTTSEGMRIQRPPLAENETAELNLTEQEKRDMLIRYFEQMINMLER